MKSVNFEFIREQNEVLANLGGYAEAVLHLDPGSALTRLRSFAEEFTKFIYHIERLPSLPRANFYDLVSDVTFKSAVPKPLIHQINFLRVQGNETAHGAQGDVNIAAQALQVAHQLAQYLAMKYQGQTAEQLPKLTAIPDPNQSLKTLEKTSKKTQQELEEKSKALEQVMEALEAERLKSAKDFKQPSDKQLAQQQAQGQVIADSLQWDEAKTRKLLIDSMLVKAGWDLSNTEQVTLEQKLNFAGNVSGTGYADYVLWGDNGLPLAVIEAKRSGNQSLQAGREQARLYADSLEVQYGQRPVIFYTNGYETFIWDDHQYNTYRPVYGLYSKESLDYLIYQRHYRQSDLEQNNPRLDIADRPYQIEAIKTVAAHFQNQRRKALIIQATGTGKTRVAIALTELMLKAGWAKRVLFLCDRKELRSQANDAFKEHLTSEARCVIGETGKSDQNARIYVSTYPGMMNRFAQLDVGFFDLIIADESHRSIYNRFRDIFDYFDALQVGLTATPVKFISRNTFDMFGCETTDPTFEFGLDAAVNNEPPYLVPFRVKDMTTEFLREGIHYNDLSSEQQAQLEEDLGEEAKNTTIAGKDIGRKIFSESTDRLILENLIENGIKDETGSLVGKTIIFAQRQDHAEHLEQLFCKLYPQYGAKVCKVIHNKIPHVESVIKDFKKPDNDFRIAISVDMLDTGIDVPEVVNLVFAKPVKSWVKFWQMIGRGTRLCPNLFGPSKDKTEFLIFDHYSNFSFFEEEYKEPEDTAGGKSLLQTTFEVRLSVAQTALKLNHAAGFDTATTLLKQDINDLNEDSIAVKRNLRLVHQLQQTDALAQMNAQTQLALETTIAPLMTSRALKDKHATAFDKLIAETQLCWLQNASCLEDCKTQILATLDKLAVNLKIVRAKDAEIAEVQSADFWQAVTIDKLEYARSELRGIMKYIQTGGGGLDATPLTKTQDGQVQDEERSVYITGADEALLYRRKVKQVLDEMITAHPVLQKIRNGETVEVGELQQLNSQILTSHPGVDMQTLNEFYGRKSEELQTTIRELVGLDPQAVEAHFKDFLHQHSSLTAKQVQFMNLLKTYLAQNGFIVVDKLYDAPFSALSPEGIDGVFTPDDADELFEVLQPYLRKEDAIISQ